MMETKIMKNPTQKNVSYVPYHWHENTRNHVRQKRSQPH